MATPSADPNCAHRSARRHPETSGTSRGLARRGSRSATHCPTTRTQGLRRPHRTSPHQPWGNDTMQSIAPLMKQDFSSPYFCYFFLGGGVRGRVLRVSCWARCLARCCRMLSVFLQSSNFLSFPVLSVFWPDRFWPVLASLPPCLFLVCFIFLAELRISERHMFFRVSLSERH